MGKKKKKYSSLQIAKELQRKLAKQQGFFDGRFKEKIIRNKKKEFNKSLARKKIDLSKEI